MEWTRLLTSSILNLLIISVICLSLFHDHSFHITSPAHQKYSLKLMLETFTSLRETFWPIMHEKGRKSLVVRLKSILSHSYRFFLYLYFIFISIFHFHIYISFVYLYFMFISIFYFHIYISFLYLYLYVTHKMTMPFLHDLIVVERKANELNKSDEITE